MLKKLSTLASKSTKTKKTSEVKVVAVVVAVAAAAAKVAMGCHSGTAVEVLKIFILILPNVYFSLCYGCVCW